ncbi:MAG: carbohydrate ABC transporter permease [Elusimicrobiota bacterium]|nr:carbohydrate ABC transporter permease [Endomicrobiia bacterium]MDW8166526.1 carbohydrate ABC transporter permease [Elusimicrobiota bacterium]
MRKNQFFKYFTIFIWLSFILIPYIWMFITSIKSPNELYTFPLKYFPHKPTLEGYKLLIETTPFLSYMKNSIIVAIFTVIIALFVAILASYSFSRFDFKGKMPLSFIFLITQMFPAILLAIPLFLLMRNLGILNTPLSLILAHSTFAVPFSTWMITGFLNSIPRELDEAAQIDGCGKLGALRHVIIPVASPGIIAATIYIFIYSWNEFLYALTFTSDIRARTIPVGLHTFMGEYIIRWDLLTAGGVITGLPVIIFFMIIQKYLIKGLTEGAVKG